MTNCNTRYARDVCNDVAFKAISHVANVRGFQSQRTLAFLSFFDFSNGYIALPAIPEYSGVRELTNNRSGKSREVVREKSMEFNFRRLLWE